MIGKTGKRNNRCSVHRVHMGGRALHEANEVINVSRGTGDKCILLGILICNEQNSEKRCTFGRTVN